MRATRCLIAALLAFFLALPQAAEANGYARPDLPANDVSCAEAAALPADERDLLLRAPAWDSGWEYGLSMLCVNLPYPLPPRFASNGMPLSLVLREKDAEPGKDESYLAHSGQMELELFVRKNGLETSLGPAGGIAVPSVYAVDLLPGGQTEFFILWGQGSVGCLFRVAREDGTRLTGSDIFEGATQRGQLYFLDPEFSQAGKAITIYRNESSNDKNAWTYAWSGEKYRLIQTVDYKGYVTGYGVGLCVSHVLDEKKGVWRRGVVADVFNRDPVRMLVIEEAPLYMAPAASAWTHPPYVEIVRQPEVSPAEGRNSREYSPEGKKYAGDFLVKADFQYAEQGIPPGTWVDVIDMVVDEVDRDNPHQGWFYVSYMEKGKRIAGWINYDHVLIMPFLIKREPLSGTVMPSETAEKPYTYRLDSTFYIGGRKKLDGEEWYAVKGGWGNIWIKKTEFEAYLSE